MDRVTGTPRVGLLGRFEKGAHEEEKGKDGSA